MSDDIKVDGLRNFQKALRGVDKAFVKELRQANLAIAKSVLEGARGRAASHGGVEAKAARTLRAGAQQRNAYIRLGGARAPYALGAEFGSYRYRQFKKWRGNQWQPDAVNGVGYFLHPTIRDQREHHLESYSEALDRISHEAFPE